MDIPLDPGRGGRSIATAAMNVGDIVVSTTPDFGSGVIRRVTGSEVSHAGVYIGDDQVVESITEGGVVRQGIYESLTKSRLAVAYRRPGMTLGQAIKMRKYLLDQRGKGYDYGGAAGLGLPRASLLGIAATIIGRGEDRFFCSELVVAAFKHAGAPLTLSQAFRASPETLATLGRNGVLEYVGHLKTSL